MRERIPDRYRRIEDSLANSYERSEALLVNALLVGGVGVASVFFDRQITAICGLIEGAYAVWQGGEYAGRRIKIRVLRKADFTVVPRRPQGVKILPGGFRGGELENGVDKGMIGENNETRG